MRYEFHPEALDEFEAAARFYADRQPGLELRFISCVERAFQQICETPAQWRPFEDSVRRYLVHVFPYAVLYSIESDYVLIVGSDAQQSRTRLLASPQWRRWITTSDHSV